MSLYEANSDFKVTVFITLKCRAIAGYYREIVSVGGVGSKIAEGLNAASWTQSYATYDSATTFPCNTINFYAAGYFSYTVNVSGGISAGLPGFGLTYTVGTNVTYTSNPFTAHASYTAF